MRWILALVALFSLFSLCRVGLADDEPVVTEMEPDAALRYILAADKAWHHEHARIRMSAEERSQGTFGPERVTGVAWDGAVSLHVERFSKDLSVDEMKGAQPEILRVVTRDASGRWMVAGQGNPQIRHKKKWNAWTGASVQTTRTLEYAQFWVKYPMSGMTLTEFLSDRPIVRAWRVGPKLMLHVVPTEDLARASRGEAELDVLGHLGWIVTLLPKRGCRLEKWELVVAAPVGVDGKRKLPPGRDGVQLASFLGSVEERVTASDWTTVAGQWFPRAVTRELRTNEGAMKVRGARTVSYRELEELPAGFEMALVPPAHLGPVGVMLNRETQTREVFDRRPEAERINAQEELVDRMVDDARSLGASSDDTSRDWMWITLAGIAGLVLLAVFLRRRRRVA